MKAVAVALLLLLMPLAAYAANDAAVPPKLSVPGDANGPISKKIVNDYYESCLYHIPDRFTPDARKYYCACNAAAVQGNFLMQDFTELQRPSSRKPGNKLFDKYVHVAVAPCLTDVPVEQIEYLACLLSSSDDVRIGYAPGYCTCVTKKIISHAKKMAEIEIMSKLAEDPSLFKDPVDALWSNQVYITTKYQSRDECLKEGH